MECNSVRNLYMFSKRKAMGKFNCILPVIILFYCITFPHPVSSLYCYSCVEEKENWKCNDNEPVTCRDHEKICVTVGETFISKGCAEYCPSSRGDQQSQSVCVKCHTDLCNTQGLNEEREPIPDLIEKHDAMHEEGTHYILYAETLTFWEARAKCVQNGGVLANIHSKTIQEFITKSILNDSHAAGIMEVTPFAHQDSFGAWIGLYKSKTTEQGNWTWLWTDDGSPISKHAQSCDTAFETFENWEAEPTHDDGQLCGYLSTQGKWKSTSCGKRVSWYLCEHAADNTVRQSIITNDTVYTYKFRIVASDGARLACDENMVEVTPNEYFLGKFKYMSEINTNLEQCNGTGDDAVVKKESIPPQCNKSYQFVLCSRPLQSDCSVDENESKHRTTAVPGVYKSTSSCDQFLYQDENITFTFGPSPTDQYAASQEKCSDGRPIAIMWCNNQKFTDFDKIPCDINLIGALTQISSNDEPLDVSLEEIQKLNFLSLQQSESVPPNYVMHVEAVLESILHDGKNVEEAFPYLVRMTSDLQAGIPKSRTSTHTSNSSRMLANAKTKLVDILEGSAATINLTANDSRKDYPSDNIEVEVVLLNEENIVDSSISHESADEDIAIRVFPDESLSYSRTQIRVVFVVYDGDELFPSDDENLQVDSVVSASVTDGFRTYSVPVEFSFRTTNNNATDGVCQRRECRYYDPTKARWERDGCRKTSETYHGWGQHTVTCTCDHTTSFAVVVSQQAQQNHALDVGGTIGLIACIICLTLTIILFLTTPELKKIRCGFIHINLCICLDISYLVFLIGIEQTSNRYLCLMTAAIIHFFLVSSWGWMGVESLTMYRMFVRPLSRKTVVETPKVAFAVYLISAAIVLVTLSFSVLAQYQGWGDGKGCSDDFWSSYVADGYCWLQGRSLYFGFLPIAFLTLVINCVAAAFIIRAITQRKAEVTSRQDDKPHVHILRALLIAMLLGLAWVFAVPLVVSDNPVVQNVFGWLFAATTSFQGVFIFYFFCIRRKDVRATWMRCFRNIVKPKRHDSTTESATGLRGARTESFLYLPNTSRSLRSTSEDTQKTAM